MSGTSVIAYLDPASGSMIIGAIAAAAAGGIVFLRRAKDQFFAMFRKSGPTVSSDLADLGDAEPVTSNER